MAKKGNNEDSIYKDKTGKWRGAVTLYTLMESTRQPILSAKFLCSLKLHRFFIREINVHGLRHKFATRALESGMSIKTLPKILGHANSDFTMDIYAHVTDDLMNDEMTNLQDFLD